MNARRACGLTSTRGRLSVGQGGGGFFALHTASACWDNKVEHPTDARSDEFHHMINCEFGGHSPYKDYVGRIIDPVQDPITQGMADYIVSDELCESPSSPSSPSCKRPVSSRSSFCEARR